MCLRRCECGAIRCRVDYRENSQPLTSKLQSNNQTQTDYQQALESRIASLDEIVASAAFHNEMKLFLPTNVYDRTLGQDKFKSFMLGALKKMLTEVHTKLFGSSTP